MADTSQLMFSFPELATILVRTQSIHEGHWGVVMRFGIMGGNIPDSKGNLLPTAIVPVIEIGIQKFDEPNSLTVDAAEINPRDKTAKNATARAKATKGKRKSA